MLQGPTRRGLLLLVLMVIGVIAVAVGTKYDNPYVFVPGVAFVVGGFVAFTNAPRR